jgi:nitrate/nitrite transporter NarK
MPSFASVRRRRAMRLNVALLATGLAFDALTKDGIALFLPIIRDDLGMTYGEGGSLAAVRTVIYAVMQIPAGYLADRFGPRRVFLTGIVGTMLTTMHFAVVTDFWQAAVNQAFSGFFRGFLFAPGLALIVAWFPERRRATALGIYGAGGVVGTIVPALVGPPLVSAFTWRFPFLVFAVAGLAFAAVFWRHASEPAGVTVHHVHLREALRVFRHRVIWAACGLQTVRLVVFEASTFWLPSLLVERGMSLQLAGALVAVRVALSAPANIFGGYVSDRLRNPPHVIAVALVVIMATTALLALLDSHLALFCVAAINGAFVQAYLGPLYTVPIEVLGERTVGTATGITNAIGQFGALLGTFMLGVLRDSTGSFVLGFAAIASTCVAGLGLTWWLARIRSAALDTANTTG